MKIYIPSHLRGLELVDQMCKMIEVYGRDYQEDYNTSFTDFYEFYLKSDPVKKFLGMMIKKGLGQSEEVYESQINYISSLFYSVKGTEKVLYYIREFLGSGNDPLHPNPNPLIVFDPNIPMTYAGTYLTIVIDSITLKDENLFFESFMNFLEALLYFDSENSIVKINLVSLIIDSELRNYVDVNLINYVEYGV